MRKYGVEDDSRREFAEFYAAARDECLRTVLVAAGDWQLAEDLVAEAFVRAWKAWPKLREHPAPRAWIVRTALNARVSWWRRHRRETAMDAQAERQAVSSYPGLDTSLVAALRRLPVRQREVIALRLLLDLDTEATAQTLGIPASTVSFHLRRGLAALRRELPSADYQERVT
jgi:RNA polymerase sigma factor (sigma-70 family)